MNTYRNSHARFACTKTQSVYGSKRVVHETSDDTHCTLAHYPTHSQCDIHLAIEQLIESEFTNAFHPFCSVPSMAFE